MAGEALGREVLSDRRVVALTVVLAALVALVARRAVDMMLQGREWGEKKGRKMDRGKKERWREGECVPYAVFIPIILKGRYFSGCGDPLVPSPKCQDTTAPSPAYRRRGYDVWKRFKDPSPPIGKDGGGGKRRKRKNRSQNIPFFS